MKYKMTSLTLCHIKHIHTCKRLVKMWNECQVTTWAQSVKDCVSYNSLILPLPRWNKSAMSN